MEGRDDIATRPRRAAVLWWSLENTRSSTWCAGQTSFSVGAFNSDFLIMDLRFACPS